MAPYSLPSDDEEPQHQRVSEQYVQVNIAVLNPGQPQLQIGFPNQSASVERVMPAYNRLLNYLPPTTFPSQGPRNP